MEKVETATLYADTWAKVVVDDFSGWKIGDVLSKLPDVFLEEHCKYNHYIHWFSDDNEYVGHTCVFRLEDGDSCDTAIPYWINREFGTISVNLIWKFYVNQSTEPHLDLAGFEVDSSNKKLQEKDQIKQYHYECDLTKAFADVEGTLNGLSEALEGDKLGLVSRTTMEALEDRYGRVMGLVDDINLKVASTTPWVCGHSG